MSSPPLNRQSRVDQLASALSLQEWFYREYPVEVCAEANILVSPCRSKVASVEEIGQDGLVPEKKLFGRRRYFSLHRLVQQDEAVKPFLGGSLINQYLSPWDYHFLIFPTAGKVQSSFAVDGFNLPVVAWGGAILRNSKLVTVIQTRFGFPLGIVMIASWMVGGMEPFFELGRCYERAERFGRFRVGSTVVLLFPPQTVQILCRPGQKLELGDSIACVK